MDGWKDKKIDGWMVRWMAKKLYEKNMDGWMAKKLKKQMDGWMDGQKERTN